MNKGNTPYKVLVVCMGNICRSPTGEAVLEAKAASLGVNVEIDSAGTIAYHAGERSDPRSRAVGEARGYDFSVIRARQVTANDFEYYYGGDQGFDRVLDLIENASIAFLQQLKQ